MSETYEEIVRKWYLKLRGSFTTVMMDRYRFSSISIADVENIYQDIFIAIKDNLREGKIRENTNWENYIIRVGLNMAGKKYRRLKLADSIDETKEETDDKSSSKAKRISDLISSLSTEDEDEPLNQNPEAQSLLGDELAHTPEPCASIIRMSYYGGMSDLEIAEEIPSYRDNGKDPKVNAKAIKARRWICMRDLIYRVKLSLYNAGIIDEKPVKQVRNGK